MERDLAADPEQDQEQVDEAAPAGSLHPCSPLLSPADI